MSDWRETHRETLEWFASKNATDAHRAVKGEWRSIVVAIDAALAEIDRLTAENERLTHSLRDVRDRKDRRIIELAQQLSTKSEAR